MAGPVYHYDSDLSSNTKFPEYFDKSLFIFDWMRNWIYIVRLDAEYNYKRMESFMPTTGDFRRPIDLEVGPDGSFYLLEYGSVYGIDNVDARLVRIDYNGGNRKPEAHIASKETVGLAPLKVNFSSKPSIDFDDDELTYEWLIDGKKVSTANAEYTFEKNGVFNAILKVTDPSGESDVDTLQIKVGNTPPTVAVTTQDNTTFFFDGQPLLYQVAIRDNEDKAIDPAGTFIALKYIPNAGQQIGHQQISSFNLGKSLMEGSDCKACHQINGKSVGPAFMEVAKKYQTDKEKAVIKLANKVITGGGGVWGDHAMNAHPQLSREDASAIVRYVLSLNDKQAVSLPTSGTVALNEHKDKDARGRYALSAVYTDKGGSAVPLSGSDALILRPARVQAEEADIVRNINRDDNYLGSIHHKSFFVFRNIDLKGVKQLTYRYSSKEIGATIEVHVNSAKGPIISTLNYEPTGGWENYKEISTPIQDPGGKNDLYFVFKKEQAPNHHMLSVDWIEFKR
jgi:cytochrome c